MQNLLCSIKAYYDYCLHRDEEDTHRMNKEDAHNHRYLMT